MRGEAPRTAAGRALLDELAENPLDGARYAHHVVRLRLPRVEAEAAARNGALLLDNDEAVGVLARAMHNTHNTDHEMGFPGCADEGDPEWWLSGARRLIAELRK